MTDGQHLWRHGTMRWIARKALLIILVIGVSGAAYWLAQWWINA